MIIEALPTEPQLWPHWLEQQIASPNLRALVEELDVEVDSFHEPATLESICGSRLPQVWQRGLRSLSAEQLSQLLDQPRLLFEIQERAFEACSPYWDALVNGTAAMDEISQTFETEEPPARTEPEIVTYLPQRSTWYFHQSLAAMSLAAAMLIAAVLYLGKPTASGWGLAQVESLPIDLTPAEFLRHLSGLSAQWSNKQPADAAALLARLQEYRAGCQALIEHPKAQLSPSDRQWLEQKCKKWAGELDLLIASMQAGKLIFTDASNQANDIASRMTKVLRDQADKLG